MSSFKNNQIYKKTSFLSGVNSSFIEKYYVQYLTNPSSLPNSWKLFFDGLGDEQDIITQNINGPSWAPEKIISEKNLKNIIEKKKLKDETFEDIASTEQAAKDSVRAIMLIRAYRIRGHLIANLDPLGLQKKEEHSELKPEFKRL
jgi:2-oxoglutarate dehydrogenase E1 component